MSDADLELRDIYRARRAIGSVVRRTRLIDSPLLSETVGADVYLKLETDQETGSFKVRGAANKLSRLSGEERERGVIAVSTGNHGRAVSHVARLLGVQAIVCISERVPRNKVEALHRLGAEVVTHGESQDEAEQRAREIQQERGQTLIHPFDDRDVIAGQGTIGLELLEELPEIDTALVPLSGGGLIAGIALALKSSSPRIRVVGVSMERAPAMVESLKAGKPVEIGEEQTLADSLQGGIGLNNRHTFRMVQESVDETVLVSEEQIARAMAFALHSHQLVVEGAGAVGIAALRHGKVEAVGQNVAVVVSGGNVDARTLLDVAGKHLP